MAPGLIIGVFFITFMKKKKLMAVMISSLEYFGLELSQVLQLIPRKLTIFNSRCPLGPRYLC